MKLPGHPVRTGQARRGLPGKEISLLLCPLAPQGWGYGALAGQYPHSPSVNINFFTPFQLKKQRRVGRFFWKNLEAKPLNFELA